MLKKYFIQTFGCQMNQADSEKINMVLLQSWFMRAAKIEMADLVVFNTCSVRQKGEDRVFGMIREIKKRDTEKSKKTLCAITGCMVRKTWIAKRHIPEEKLDTNKKRKTAKQIDYLASWDEIFNYEDKLFPRSESIDFVFRIEETKYIPHILSHIFGEKIGQEDKFDDYLKQVQQRENPSSASVIIQTGCDNYCSFCIVPYTRGKEISRNHNEIVSECRQAVESGAKEITLLGQNVNSYGKQQNLKLWNEEKSKWNNTDTKLKIAVDLDETLFIVLCQEIIDSFNQKYNKIMKLNDVLTYDLNGIPELLSEYKRFEIENEMTMKLQPWWDIVLKRLKNQWHNFYVITSRDLSKKESTEKYLEKIYWEGFFTEIIFAQENFKDKKYEAANKIWADIVIDDWGHHIKWYYKNFSWKVCIYNQKWNTNIKEDNSKTYRIHDWYEFEKLLPKLSFTSPFRKLLADIDSIPGIDRIRFTSSNPHDMTRDILDAHFDLKHTCNYLHFALQSWNNAMLKKMNRRHTYEDFRNMVQHLREKDPLFSISTDIIVGFSWETDEMFQDTVKAFKECMFDFCYTARYSVRPNTIAAKVMPDDVSDMVKAERWHILNNLLLENIQIRNKLMLGRTEEILISWEKDEQFFGRTRNFKEVFFEKSPDYKMGDIISVKITDMDRYVLQGKIS